MNHTHPIIHAVMAMNVAFAFVSDNPLAAIAWATAWCAWFCYDFYMHRLRLEKKMLELFMLAHGGKWPSKAAEDKAVEELREFVKGGK